MRPEQRRRGPLSWSSGALCAVLVLAACGREPQATVPTANAEATPSTDAAAATPAAPEDPLAQARRFVEIARTGALAKRPQAAQRLGTLGEPAVLALHEVIGTTTRDLARVGPELLAPMGALGDEALRARLWAAVVDRDFPYRPAATQSLAETARASEWPAFEELLADPLSAVRSSTLAAFGVLDAREREALVVARLEDTSDLVRRTAADLLARWERPYALRWLVEDLARSDRFFELESGENARYEAARLLRRHFDRELFGYDPAEDPSAPGNAAALARLAEEIDRRAGADGPRPSARVQRSSVSVTGVLGLEVRSCRRGEFHVAIGDDDVLRIGLGHPVEVPLEPGAAQRLAALLAERFPVATEPQLVGELGCDLECYRLRTGDGGALIVRVMKGPDEVPDLRPAHLDAVAAALLAELPGTLAADVAVPAAEGAFDALLDAALASVGGALEPEPAASDAVR